MSGRAAIIGSAGMLGRAMCHRLPDAAGFTRDQLNITDAASIDAQLTEDFDVVINGAAWTNVDGAEDHEAQAMRLNGEAVGRLAARCRAIDALLVHYSTDYVFNGQADAPYRVDHPREPINTYGRTKLAGEQAIETSGARYLLIRTSWLYAPWAKNFVLTMVRLGSERDRLRVVNDQRGRPTSAEHLADATVRLIDGGHTGTFHVTDGGECTWFDFATAIVGATNPDCAVEPCTTADFPTPAKRPAYSVLDLSKTEAAIGPMPMWHNNLTDVLERIE